MCCSLIFSQRGLWTMVDECAAFYRSDTHRSKQAFEQPIRDWKGILISDNSHGCHTKWADRQTWLVPLIQNSDLLAEKRKRSSALSVNFLEARDLSTQIDQDLSGPRQMHQVKLPECSARSLLNLIKNLFQNKSRI